jgi:hypothetical protein
MPRGSAAAPVPALAISLAALCLLPATARSQEAIHTDSAAAVPSVGRVSLRQTLTYMMFDGRVEFEDVDVQEWRAVTTVEYGLRNDLALSLYLPLVVRDDDNVFLGIDSGVDDFTVAAKWRVYRNDFGPIDTSRLSIVGAVELPSGMDEFSSDSVDPILGAVYSYIRGRHGFNADVRWKFTTGGEEIPLLPGEGTADALLYNFAYLYRLQPAEFGASNSAGAVYGVIELNGAFETNRDNQILLAPGLLFESRTFAVEASVQFPVLQNMDDRPDTRFTFTFGLRFLF